MNIIKEMEDFQDLMDDLNEEEDLDDMDEIDLLGGEEDSEFGETTFNVMKEVMASFKDFCDKVEMAWKIQELPATLRQRLITIDKSNQDRYQKMYQWIQKYQNDMKKTKISDLPEKWNKE